MGLGLVVGLAAAAAPGARDKAPTDDRLVGKWVAVSATENGKTVALETADPAAHRYAAGGGWALVIGGREREKGTFRLGPKGDPRAIDLVFPDEEKTGRPWTGRGVYRIDGDELTLCPRWGAGDGDRPVGFAAPAGSPDIVWVFRRMKPKD
jgi:uncharacterized protein (TIGR03067 family)